MAIITYSMPLMTGRPLYDTRNGHLAFWFANLGMLGMTSAFAVAGIAQVYLERIMGLDLMVAAKETEVHFLVLIIAASVFTIGILLFIVDFIKHGLPNEDAMRTEPEFEAVFSEEEK